MALKHQSFYHSSIIQIGVNHRTGDESCTWDMIHNKIHLISQGCPRPSVALQHRIVARNNIHSHSNSRYIDILQTIHTISVPHISLPRSTSIRAELWPTTPFILIWYVNVLLTSIVYYFSPQVYKYQPPVAPVAVSPSWCPPATQPLS